MSSPTAWHQALAVTVEVRRLVALADVDAILLTHQRGRMLSAGGERGDNAGIGRHALARGITQPHRNIAQPALMPDTANRAALQPFIELLLGPGK